MVLAFFFWHYLTSRAFFFTLSLKSPASIVLDFWLITCITFVKKHNLTLSMSSKAAFCPHFSQRSRGGLGNRFDRSAVAFYNPVHHTRSNMASSTLSTKNNGSQPAKAEIVRKRRNEVVWSLDLDLANTSRALKILILMQALPPLVVERKTKLWLVMWPPRIWMTKKSFGPEG